MDALAAEPAVSMRGIVKRFPGVVANDQVDLDVARGEIHALLGENGAGKTTLMNVLSGLYRADSGAIHLRGRPVSIHSPRHAIQAGIGMVHQHFMLVRPLTVTENIILGLAEPRLDLDLRRARKRVEELSRRYGLRVNPRAYVWQLSIGEQQRVEILRQLYRGAEVLILDEPTAVLTPQEAEELGRTLRTMTEEGKAVIFITHKLAEVMAFSDRVTVLRAGRNVATLQTRETTSEELARLMVGREVLFRLERAQTEPGPPVLELDGVHALGDGGLPALRGLSFQMRAGEILGVAGVAGNGQRELAEVITGLRRTSRGQIRLGDHPITNASAERVNRLGVSHVPEDRLGMGLVPNLPVSDNLILRGYRFRPLARGPFLNGPAILSFAADLVRRFEIRTPGLHTPARLLSGGNQQKAILAREITAGQEVMVAVHPTRGLDVGATEAVRNTLLELRSGGAAVLLISEDLDELLALSNRIAVLYEGEIMGIVRPEETGGQELGLMMAGRRRDGILAERPAGGGETA